MTDAKFKQLVNSFLDREISQKDHLLLSREVASSPQRRTEFERYKRLHAAERQALARLFADSGGEDPLADADGDAEGNASGGIGDERRRMAEQLKARAARAWSEVQLLTVERKKRRLLIWQFVLAGLALLCAALALYRQSVGTIPGSGNYRKESEAINPESAHLAQLRDQLRQRQGISVGWISNERGDPVALVGRNDEGGVFVMTSSELPRLSPTQLSTLLSQLPSAGPLPAAAAVSPVQPQPSRSRFVVSTRVANMFLPDEDIVLVPPPPSPSASQAQAAAPQKQKQPQRRQRAFISTGPQEPPQELDVFWGANNYHTEIRTTPAAEPQSE